MMRDASHMLDPACRLLEPLLGALVYRDGRSLVLVLAQEDLVRGWLVMHLLRWVTKPFAGHLAHGQKKGMVFQNYKQDRNVSKIGR